MKRYNYKKELKFMDENTGLLDRFLIPLLICLTFMMIFYDKGQELIYILRILYFLLSILIAVMIRINVKDKNFNYFKYVGVGFFYIGICRFFELQFIVNTDIIGIHMAFVSGFNYLEILAIFIPLIMYNKKLSKSIMHKTFISLILIMAFLIKVSINNWYNLHFVKNITILNQAVYVILVFITYKEIKKYKNLKKHLWKLEVISLIMISNLFSVLNFIFDENLTCFVFIFKIIAYFIIYRNVEKRVLKGAYEKALESLEEVQKNKKQLNNELVQREKLLVDVKMQMERSRKKYSEILKTFSEGMIIFNEEFLIYSNIKGTEFLKKYIKNEEGNLFYILCILTKGEITEDNINNGFSKIIYINENKDNEVIIEINLIVIDRLNKVLFINDITELTNFEKNKIKLEKKILEENIKDEFYSNISHELITPINVIFSALQLNEVVLNGDNLNTLEKLQKIDKNYIIIRQNCLMECSE
ncbi:hypothetical protein JCM1393_00680 [Clostridium carnis]